MYINLLIYIIVISTFFNNFLDIFEGDSNNIVK